VLDKVEFGSTIFLRCRFAGVLREVIFSDHGFRTGKRDPNPMEDIDFSAATLRWVECRGLNLDRVRWPTDDDHIVVRHLPCVLDRAVEMLAQDASPDSRALRAIIDHYRKWLGPRQDVGVFNRQDLQEGGSEAKAALGIRVLRTAEAHCAHHG
jgi:hypothetical protein